MSSSLPRTGQRVVVTPDDRIELRDFPVSPPGPGQVLIETACTLISAGTELGTQEQRRDSDYTPGYSNAGRVLAVGDGVRDYRPGDRVMSLGGHATHVVSSAAPHALRPIPDGVTDEGAAFGVLGSVAMHGVRKARVELGEYALITGMGLVGQLALRLVGHAGAAPGSGRPGRAGFRRISPPAIPATRSYRRSSTTGPGRARASPSSISWTD